MLTLLSVSSNDNYGVNRNRVFGEKGLAKGGGKVPTTSEEQKWREGCRKVPRTYVLSLLSVVSNDNYLRKP